MRKPSEKLKSIGGLRISDQMTRGEERVFLYKKSNRNTCLITFLIPIDFTRTQKPFKINILDELMTGIEPVTPSLPRKCSTSEPHQHFEIVTALYRSQLIILTEEELIVNILF